MCDFGGTGRCLSLALGLDLMKEEMMIDARFYLLYLETFKLSDENRIEIECLMNEWEIYR